MSNLTEAAEKIQAVADDLRKMRGMLEAAKRKRDEEVILDMLDEHGLSGLKSLIEQIHDQSREPDDRYLDDPRRGQAEWINGSR